MSQLNISNTAAKWNSLPISKSIVANPSMWGKTSSVFNDLFSDVKVNPHLKKYNVNDSAEDLLALSVAWHRIRSFPRLENTVSFPKIESLTDTALFEQVTSEDRIRANEIRDYYSKKIVVWALKEVKLSPFRTDLSKFVHSDGKIFTDEMLPLAYRLPEFYDYDVSFADMVRDLSRYNEEERHEFSYGKLTKLTPLRKFDIKRKHSRQIQYWFKDELERPVLIILEHNKSCKSLFEREFSKESIVLRVHGAVSITKDDYFFLNVSKWEVE